MANRRFDVYQYRHVLARMRQGDSDRDISRSKKMGRKKIAQVRQIAQERGWLVVEEALPSDDVLAEVLGRKPVLSASCVSTLEPWRELVTQWHAAGVQGTTIHATLKRNHAYAGSYSSMQRFLAQLAAAQDPDVPLRLTFKPAEAAQVDFGAGPAITDVYTGEIFKTWFFVMTLAWSRHQYAEFVRDQTVGTWLGCHRRAFEWFGGSVPRIIIDNAKCAITKACVFDPQVQRAYADCAEGYSFKIDACPPEDPAKKA
jgi:transposase